MSSRKLWATVAAAKGARPQTIESRTTIDPAVSVHGHVDEYGHPAHLHLRNTSLALVSRAPLANIESYRKRMGWTFPWYSSADNDFNVDFGRTTSKGEMFGLSVFLRDGNDIYRTYFTEHRGVEELGSVWSFLDRTPYGRQEGWEDSPSGWPQTAPYTWWRRHDVY